MMIFPKLLVDRYNGRLFAYTGPNYIAYRFGRQIGVVRVGKVWGPIYRRIGTPFFDSIDNFRKPEVGEA